MLDKQVMTFTIETDSSMSVESKIKVHPQHCALWLDKQRESEQCLKRSQVAVPWSDSNSDYQLLHHGNVCKCVCAYDNMSFSLSSACSWPHSSRFLKRQHGTNFRPANFKKDLQPLWMKYDVSAHHKIQQSDGRCDTNVRYKRDASVSVRWAPWGETSDISVSFSLT